jgi:hypothetical protein
MEMSMKHPRSNNNHSLHPQTPVQTVTCTRIISIPPTVQWYKLQEVILPPVLEEDHPYLNHRYLTNTAPVTLAANNCLPHMASTAIGISTIMHLILLWRTIKGMLRRGQSIPRVVGQSVSRERLQKKKKKTSLHLQPQFCISILHLFFWKSLISYLLFFFVFFLFVFYFYSLIMKFTYFHYWLARFCAITSWRRPH